MNRELFDLYTDYVLSSIFRRTATGLSDLLDGAISHDKVTRFLSREDYGSKELWHHVKPFVRQAESEDGVLIFDDTIEEKPYTDESEAVCWCYDHTQQRNVKGINILTALVRYEEASFPVTYDIVKKTETYLDEKTGKEKRKSKQTKNEMFREMLCRCRKNHLKFKYVLADSWFASKENMEAVLQHEKHFVFAIKANRMVALTEEAKQRGEFTAIRSLKLEKDQAVRVYLKGLEVPVLLVKQVFTNKDGSTGELFLVCSDLSLEGPQMIEIYQKRWKIEEFHKSIKSNVGLEKSPTKTVRTQCNHIFACICAYVKLESLSLKRHLNHFALKYKLVVKANQSAWLEFQIMKTATT